MRNAKLMVFIVLLSTTFALPAAAQTSGGLPPIRRAESASISPEAAQDLINQGWKEFIGASGLVNEKKARDLTLSGINAIKEDSIKRLTGPEAEGIRRVRSVGLNNLLVFDRCAFDSKVRLSSESQNKQSRQEYQDTFSIDNAIWDVYLRRRTLSNVEEFIRFVRVEVGTHPINRYIAKLGSRLPESVDEAYRVLEEFAADGDPEAALRLAFRFECREEPPQLQQSITWYGTAISNYEKVAGSQRRITSAKERLQRLRLIQEGKIRRD